MVRVYTIESQWGGLPSHCSGPLRLHDAWEYHRRYLRAGCHLWLTPHLSSTLPAEGDLMQCYTWSEFNVWTTLGAWQWDEGYEASCLDFMLSRPGFFELYAQRGRFERIDGKVFESRPLSHYRTAPLPGWQPSRLVVESTTWIGGAVYYLANCRVLAPEEKAGRIRRIELGLFHRNFWPVLEG